MRKKTFPCYGLVSPSRLKGMAGKRKFSNLYIFPHEDITRSHQGEVSSAMSPHATLPSSTCPPSTMLPKHSQMFSTTFPKHQHLCASSPGPDLQHAAVAGQGRRNVVFGSGSR